MTISFPDIIAARARLAGQLVDTPCLYSKTLSQIAGCELYLKFENLQFTASFKERGAANKLASLSDAERARGVITVSAGNHAQGVAYSAARLGVRAVIVMPIHTPFVKVENTRRLGAEVIQRGDSFGEARSAMLEIAERDQQVIVHPYDDAAVIAGQGTLALEMLEQAPRLDTLVVPIGGGGLMAGMAIAARQLRPDIELVGVQAAHFPAMREQCFGQSDALNTEGPSGSAAMPTIAEGIAVDRPGRLCVPIIRQHVNRIDLVSEAELERAIIALLEIEKTVAEGAGAASLAAVLAAPERFRGRQVGLVLSGGNIDSLTLSDIIQRSLVRSRRLARLSVSARDIPGTLAQVATLLGNQGANIEEVIHQRAFADLPVRHVRIELVVSTRGEAHLAAVIDALNQAGFTARVADR